MKKIIALFCVFLMVSSCSLDHDKGTISFEVLPVDSYVMPAEFHVNTENNIVIKFLRPTTCHGFDSFYYVKEGFTRTVAIQSYIYEQNSECVTLNNQIIEKTLHFMPSETGTYTFKFWKGKDTNGVDVFEEVVIDVI